MSVKNIVASKHANKFPMVFTIFTPTYNRAHLLARAYQSLVSQNFQDFEWLIVDDGSTDETEAVVRGFIDDGKLDIRYIKKPNGGKHTAINLGAREARGELFFILDSDDKLPTDALEKTAHYWQQIRDDSSFAGLCGLDAYFDGRVVGGGLPQTTIDCTSLEIRFSYGVKGDLKEVFRTSVLRECPFPEIPGERFCPEALLWNRIAQKYKLRFFNEVIYQCEYQDGGLTDRIVRIRMDSPVASTTTYQEMTTYNIPFAQKVKAAINYWRFYPCLKDKQLAPRLSTMWIWTRPIGCLMHNRDKKNTGWTCAK